MLLAVDVGNTQTVFGLYDGPELGERWRIATEAQRTGDELGALLADFLDLSAIDGICLSSTVPRLVPEYEHVAERWAKAELLVIGPGVRTGIEIQYDDPREVGPDRVDERGGGQGALRRAGDRRRLRHLHELRRCVAGRGVRRRRPGARDRGLDGSALRAGGPAREGRLRRAAAGDRQDDRRRAAVRARLRLRRPGGRNRRRDPRRARGRGAGDRYGRPGRPDRPALPDDRPRRAVPHARRPANRLGAEPLAWTRPWSISRVADERRRPWSIRAVEGGARGQRVAV